MNKRFEFQKPEKESLLTDALVIVDKETGVNYLFHSNGNAGGLTPLLNRDGTPVITTVFEDEE